MHDFKIYNYLILLHVKFVKMLESGFFDSLAIICEEFYAGKDLFKNHIRARWI